jgi:hypothetical protein
LIICLGVEEPKAMGLYLHKREGDLGEI